MKDIWCHIAHLMPMAVNAAAICHACTSHNRSVILTQPHLQPLAQPLRLLWAQALKQPRVQEPEGACFTLGAALAPRFCALSVAVDRRRCHHLPCAWLQQPL